MKKQIDKDLENTKEVITLRMSHDRKTNLLRHEYLKESQADILRQMQLLTASVEATNLLYKNELEKIKEETWLLRWFYNHKKVTVLIISIIAFTFFEKIYMVYELFKTKITGS